MTSPVIMLNIPCYNNPAVNHCIPSYNKSRNITRPWHHCAKLITTSKSTRVNSVGKRTMKKMAVPAGITESIMVKIAPYNNIECAINNE